MSSAAFNLPLPSRALVGVALVAMTGLAACADPRYYESDPVVVPHAQGPVTCQLYTVDILAWDRSTNRPDAMSVATADALCEDAGRRRLNGTL